MKLFEITQPVNEVNWGAIPGALGGIAKQAMGIEPAPVPPGQERRAGMQLTTPLTNQQADSMKKTWAAAVQAEMAARGITDIRKLPPTRLQDIMKTYIENRLFAGRMRVSDLSAPLPNLINQATQRIINNSGDLSDPTLDKSFEDLAKYIQNAMASDVFTRGKRGVPGMPAPGGVAGASDPEIQQIQQQFAREIALMQSAGRRYNQPIQPTRNKLINAIADGLGLLP